MYLQFNYQEHFVFKLFSLIKQFRVLINPYISYVSGATTLGQSAPGSNGNEGVLRIPQSSSITSTSPSDSLVSYPRHGPF